MGPDHPDVLRLLPFREAHEPDQRDALTAILDWCDAYPATVFPEPDLDAARKALEAAGVSMDGLHGSWARHLLDGIKRIAQRGLEGMPS